MTISQEKNIIGDIKLLIWYDLYAEFIGLAVGTHTPFWSMKPF